MKKVLLMLAIVFAAVIPSQAAETWGTFAKLMATEMNGLSSDMQSAFASQGLDCRVYSQYTSSTKSLDITIDFKSLDLIPYLDNSAMQASKESFLQSFVSSSLEDGPDNLRLLTQLMTDANGSIKMIFKGAGKSKSVTITGPEIKRYTKANFGVTL